VLRTEGKFVPGPDVFLSYNREDSGRAKHFAEGFKAQGLDVWWDVALRSGEAYDEVTENALRSAKAIVVLWSPRSVASRWVRAEATLAERKKTLMPAMIEPCVRPIMFELVQTAELSHWQGDAGDQAWREFARQVREFIGKGAQASPASTVSLPALNQVTIVVLPFTNMSGDAEQEYFADGISEDIITDLSKVSALGVISRNSAFTFKGKHVDAADVARQLNVTHLLEGSVRKSGNRIRVTAQLIDGSTNSHIWADRYDRSLNDIFALQDELSQAIVGALKIKLLPEERKAIQTRGTDNVEAHDFYLRASSAFAATQLDTASAFARAAVALDPRFLEAWELLGIVHLNAGVSSKTESAHHLARSDAALAKVAEIAPDSPKAVGAKATRLFALEQNWLGAEDIYAQGDARVSIGPSGPDRAYLLGSVGRVNEAVGLFKDWIRSDPMMAAPVFGYLLDCAGRYDEAAADHERMRKLQLHSALIEYFTLLRCMARGDPIPAIAAQIDRCLAQGVTSVVFLREAKPCLGDKAAMNRLLHWIYETGDEAADHTSHLLGIAQFAAYSGEHEFALECLQQVWPLMRGGLHISLWHPLLAGARQLPGFKQLARDVGYYDYWRKCGHWGDYARSLGDDDFEMIA
jgi:TolB-like protein